jgi:hypothetical protein
MLTMTMSIATAAECEALALSTLGLADSGVDLFSTEGIAASLRRAACFLCPCAPRQIVDAVLEVLRPVRPEPQIPREDVVAVLDLLIAGGDLLELRQGETQKTRLIYLGPPTYVEKEQGRYLIAGVRPFGAPLIPGDLGKVTYERHVRSIEIDPADAASMLRALGLHRLEADKWVRQPARMTAAALIDQVQIRLDAALVAGDATQFLVIDPAKRVTYYKGRWRHLQHTDCGVFITRRPQAYVFDVWCALRVSNGVPQRLLDFPIDNPVVPGRDEAWRFQAAIDAVRGTPQLYRMASIDGPGSDVIVDFFSPLPGWAERRLQLVAVAADRSRGALFSFRASVSASEDIRRYLDEMLWMQAMEEGGGA